MTLQIGHAGHSRGPQITGIVLILLGAVVMGASAATASFDLGEDLELGKAVHDVQHGPLVAWAAAVVLVAAAGLAITTPVVAARVLMWLSVGAPVVTAVVVSLVSLATSSITGLAALPFVIAFFSVPAFITSLILNAANHTT